MKIAIMESITTPGGHEVDFDRILVEELKSLGHEVIFYVPGQFVFKYDYGVEVRVLPGDAVSYTGLRGFSKIFASAKREINRQRWFKGLYQSAQKDQFDLCIVPTSTYRYLRAINMNALKNSPVPIIFVIHGINPTEAPKFFKEAEKLRAYPNIKVAVLTFGSDVLGRSFPNVHCIYPPTYTPRDINYKSVVKKGEILKLGFFGQYRREKKLDDFLDVFLKCNYRRPVELLVQGATMRPEDSDDFERIREKYSGHSHIKFLHKGLIGKEWQEAIAGIDALLMPYSASRYLYHWAGMLFTAIGYHKPVVLSADINPEVIENYRIGMSFQSGNIQSLQKAIEEFINTFDDKADMYAYELARASHDFSPEKFARTLISLGK